MEELKIDVREVKLTELIPDVSYNLVLVAESKDIATELDTFSGGVNNLEYTNTQELPFFTLKIYFGNKKMVLPVDIRKEISTFHIMEQIDKRLIKSLSIQYITSNSQLSSIGLFRPIEV